MTPKVGYACKLHCSNSKEIGDEGVGYNDGNGRATRHLAKGHLAESQLADTVKLQLVIIVIWCFLTSSQSANLFSCSPDGAARIFSPPIVEARI